MMSVNLSGKHFTQNDLVAQISEVLAETEINPADLKLELTESAVMENAERVISMLRELKKLGVHLSIDDFGTGYSSLSQLRDLPARQLKIDRSFIRELETQDDACAVVEAVIKLAHALRLTVVAEGVETRGQRDILLRLGCDELQGFFYAPADACARCAGMVSRRDPIP